MELTKEEKIFLLKTARKSIKAMFREIEIPTADLERHPVFKSKAGAFVTLSKFSELRGCIGYIISNNPLIETVKEAAVHAAMNDPRFNEVTENELDVIDLEISVLSEPFPMPGYDQIELGVHGLILEEEGRRALLLPQVPVEHNMDLDEYLSALCQKGGFPADYWKRKKLRLSAFTATVFSEKELGGKR